MDRGVVLVGLLAGCALAGCANIVGIETPTANTSDTPSDGNTGKDSNSGAQCAPSPMFGTAVNISAGGAQSVAVGDLDHDGRKDLIVATATDVVIFRGNGNGTFGAAQPLAGTPTVATGVRVADLDDDGFDDVITWDGIQMATSHMGTNTVRAHRQVSAGSFAAAQSFTVPGNILDVQLAKLDKNTRPDLVVWTMMNGILPFTNNPATPGAFIAGSAIATNANLYQVIDIDGDGLDDIAIGSSTGTMQIFYNNTSISLAFSSPSTVGGSATSGAVFGKFGTSGVRRDAILFGNGGPFGALFVQSAPRTFMQQDVMAVGNVRAGMIEIGTTITATDINSDGLEDVVGSGEAAVQCPTGGTFYPSGATSVMPVQFGTTQVPQVLADFNGNTKLDLVQLTGGSFGNHDFVTVSLQ